MSVHDTNGRFARSFLTENMISLYRIFRRLNGVGHVAKCVEQFLATCLIRIPLRWPWLGKGSCPCPIHLWVTFWASGKALNVSIRRCRCLRRHSGTEYEESSEGRAEFRLQMPQTCMPKCKRPVRCVPPLKQRDFLRLFPPSA